jgi:hypothetical protein
MATNLNENIIFSLEEYKNNIVLDEEDLNTFLLDTNAIDTNVLESNYITAEELESYYKNSCTVRDLQQILQYYGIPKKNMIKDEMLQCILLYEMERDNREIVLRRVRLWRNIRELKADAYFGKYISFNI